MTDKEIRKYMEMAIKEMNATPEDRRLDGKVTPKVGAVIVLKSGEVHCAHRGEYRNGEHAEYVLLDKKLANVDVSGATLFTTLEPCAPGARKLPKVSCAERIADARIEKVYIGIEDPDPTVGGKGFDYLKKHNINVTLFDKDLQEKIIDVNDGFLKSAKKRAMLASVSTDINKVSYLEEINKTATWDDLSVEAISFVCDKLDISFSEGKTDQFKKFLENLQLIAIKDDKTLLTNEAVLLFAKNPQVFLPQSNVKIVSKLANGESSFYDFNNALVLLPSKFEEWYGTHMKKITTRSSMRRQDEFEFPFVPIREAFVNALVHRDYSIAGANITVKIDFEAIEISSPGYPPEPLTIEQLQNFKAPSYARNPKLASLFSMLKIVEKAGYGMSEFDSLLLNYNFPLPIVSFDGVNTKIEFNKTFESKDSSVVNSAKPEQTPTEVRNLSPEIRRGYEYIKKAGKVKTSDYADHFKYNRKKASRHIKSMKDVQLIKLTDGCSAKSPNATYEIVHKHGQNLDK